MPSTDPPTHPRIDAMPRDALDARARADAAFLKAQRRRAERLAAAIARHEPLWKAPDDALPGPDERAAALELFDRVLSYQVALDAVAGFHLEFWRIDPLAEPALHARHFALGFNAYCNQLALGLDFVDRTLNRPLFEKLFDEGAPERGIPPRAYERLKYNVVNVEHVARVFGARQYHNVVASRHYDPLRSDPAFAFVLEDLERAYEATHARLARDGVRLLLANGWDILRDAGHRAWFPVQTGVARWMGATKVHREGHGLISYPQVGEVIARHARPGDVLVERRNWYLSNIGLPGFWPHTALWLGSPRELAEFLDSDPAVRAAYDGAAFTSHLRARFPEAWGSYARPDDDGFERRLIEAVSEGVVCASAEHSLAADYAAGMRPRLAKVDIARAIERAFGYAGRPYDFDFDFDTDRELVCSELVYKAYEPRAETRGLRIALSRVLGRNTLPPNTLVAQFDREYDTPERQLDFAWFLDGREAEGGAEWGDVATFRASHLRPKWDISQE